ncbi:helix-turn-helix transcriptional regulator [Methylobacterium sp. J-077]|uniref:helix-turn-helix transcriptional regulator n=1 Tax=Methylobacterium sp. J-077 TaxID=2836656 RepID=UPI001FBA5C9E|nr:helix-turn-helix domain-containing protein [Methylobacterium sp. J-077]MCJ2126675.1 helix-turn-helix domain-containing protein [Methylobacterium sp. J-077]
MNYSVQAAQGDLRPSTGKLLHRRKDVQDALSIGHDTFYKLVAKGKLRTVKIGAATLVPDDSLRSFLNSLEQEAA